MRSTAKALILQTNWDSIPGGQCEPLTITQTNTLRMSHEEVKPPSQVWDKICFILDKQDQQKKN